ncbi:DUF3465 domain-containing protein [Hydrogenimonas sp.]
MRPKHYRNIRRYLLVLLILAGVLAYLPQLSDRPQPHTTSRAQEKSRILPVEEAQSRRLSDVWVEGEGVVVRTLRDDDRGPRHQRFILRLGNGRTLLVVHNIDLAPRIDDLRPGERVGFVGEFVDNPKGGLVHWTHHDPSGRQEGGWLKYRGKIYR